MQSYHPIVPRRQNNVETYAIHKHHDIDNETTPFSRMDHRKMEYAEGSAT